MAEQSVEYDDCDFYPDDDGELPAPQRGVHLKLFIGWVVDRGLHHNEESFDDPSITEGNRARTSSRDELFAALDGKLTSNELNDDAKAFARRYYASVKYFADFCEVCVRGNTVDESDAAYARLCQRLDFRFRGEEPPRAFWRR
jgi:hypothetical protein